MLSPDFEPLVFELRWEPEARGSLPSPEPVAPDPEVKRAVRDLLREGGYKPSGRGRPASETLLKAWEEGRFPQIHPVVDYFNLLSLRTGLPISVLDAGALIGAWQFRLGEAGESYVFNPSGQTLSLGGLLTLCDEQGPTGSPVKDAQRTKIGPESRNFLVVIWGTRRLPERMAAIKEEVSRALNIRPLAPSAGMPLPRSEARGTADSPKG